MAGCGFNFGYDVGNFSGIQGMESKYECCPRTVVSADTGIATGFGMKFGEFNEDAGRWALPAWLSSMMTSVPFFGKALVRLCNQFHIPSHILTSDTGRHCLRLDC